MFVNKWTERDAQRLGTFPADGSVSVHRLGQSLVENSIDGPKLREGLVVHADIGDSNAAFRFMDYREMDGAGRPCRGKQDLRTGYPECEFRMEPTHERSVHLAIKAAGARQGIVDFGIRDSQSMRPEKNFPT